MLIIVVWHEHFSNGVSNDKTEIVEIRKRKDGTTYREGLVRQAMRLHGYNEARINETITRGYTLVSMKEKYPAAPKIRMKCTHCNSTNVQRDAWATWSEEIQDWELSEVYDSAFCKDCEGKVRIEAEEITNDTGRESS